MYINIYIYIYTYRYRYRYRISLDKQRAIDIHIRISTNLSTFKLSFEIHFAINMSSVVRILACLRPKLLCQKWEVSFAFCNEILGISNILFNNTIKWV